MGNIPILPILVAYESWYSTYLFIFKVSKLPEFQCCCWPEYMGVENICPLWGEERWERREEKRRERSMWMRIMLGDLHPHPPKKLFHVLVVIALIVEQAWKKERSRMERKKRNKFPTHAKVSNLLCVWYGWYRDVKIRMVLQTWTALQQQVYAPFMHILRLLGLMYIPYKIFPSCRQQLRIWCLFLVILWWKLNA